MADQNLNREELKKKAQEASELLVRFLSGDLPPTILSADYLTGNMPMSFETILEGYNRAREGKSPKFVRGMVIDTISRDKGMAEVDDNDKGVHIEMVRNPMTHDMEAHKLYWVDELRPEMREEIENIRKKVTEKTGVAPEPIIDFTHLNKQISDDRERIDVKKEKSAERETQTGTSKASVASSTDPDLMLRIAAEVGKAYQRYRTLKNDKGAPSSPDGGKKDAGSSKVADDIRTMAKDKPATLLDLFNDLMRALSSFVRGIYDRTILGTAKGLSAMAEKPGMTRVVIGAAGILAGAAGGFVEHLAFSHDAHRMLADIAETNKMEWHAMETQVANHLSPQAPPGVAHPVGHETLVHHAPVSHHPVHESPHHATPHVEHAVDPFSKAPNLMEVARMHGLTEHELADRLGSHDPAVIGGIEKAIYHARELGMSPERFYFPNPETYPDQGSIHGVVQGVYGHTATIYEREAGRIAIAHFDHPLPSYAVGSHIDALVGPDRIAHNVPDVVDPSNTIDMQILADNHEKTAEDLLKQEYGNDLGNQAAKSLRR